ncbi:hypothetical protein HMPREF0972_00786 [Actinomyces sp. oral taxon 848 str. F0332]|nr:hypothetical protein HMPREF0972_00786 [Actinomyces sp. oral taxon 848 str. F0332]
MDPARRVDSGLGLLLRALPQQHSYAMQQRRKLPAEVAGTIR